MVNSKPGGCATDFAAVCHYYRCEKLQVSLVILLSIIVLYRATVSPRGLALFTLSAQLPQSYSSFHNL